MQALLPKKVCQKKTDVQTATNASSASSNIQGTRHVAELQAFRGIAAIVVLLHHCSFYFAYDERLKFAAESVLNAHAAVVAFYVLSGYVLALSLSRRTLNAQGIGEFYVKRIFRIYPVLIAASFLGLAYIFAFHGHALPGDVSPWWPQMYRNWPPHFAKIIAAFLGMGSALPIPTWSIFVEFVGSAILPVFVLTMRRNVWVFAALTAGLLLVSVTIGEHTHMWVGEYLVDFAFGASILLWRDELEKILKSVARTRLVAMTALLIALFGRQIGGWNFEQFYHAPIAALIEGLGATALVAAIACRPPAFALLRSSPAVWYGDISYDLYLIHMPVMAFVAGYAQEILRLGIFTGNPVTATIALASGTFALTTLLAAISHRWIELPGMGAGAWANERIFSRSLGFGSAERAV
jgi:peptidoglycan/LPS O-acetylase OafA/YrhL